MTEAQPYLALRAQTAGRIETDRLELGRVNLRHALAERDIDAAFDRCVDLRRRWRADRADDQILRRILDDAGRLALRIAFDHAARYVRSEEHTSELQSLMRISYAVFCLKKKIILNN